MTTLGVVYSSYWVVSRTGIWLSRPQQHLAYSRILVTVSMSNSSQGYQGRRTCDQVLSHPVRRHYDVKPLSGAWPASASLAAFRRLMVLTAKFGISKWFARLRWCSSCHLPSTYEASAEIRWAPKPVLCRVISALFWRDSRKHVARLGKEAAHARADQG